MTYLAETRPITLWQLCGRPLAAYCAASVVAGFVLFPPAFFHWALVLMITMHVAVFAAVPAIIALVVMRLAPLRRGITDTVAGGVIGASMPLLLELFLGRGEFNFDWSHIPIWGRFALAGAAGGLTYWLANACPGSHRIP